MPGFVLATGLNNLNEPPTSDDEPHEPATRSSDSKDGNLPRASTYRDCRKFIVNAVTAGRYEVVRPCEADACKEGYLTFEVVDIISLCKEVMLRRESTLKGKWLVTIREAHRQAMQYLLSAVCKKPVTSRNSTVVAHLSQMKGRLLSYAHDKKQRRAWEAFKEFLKR